MGHEEGVRGHLTPEEAARGTRPGAKVIATNESPDGSHAVVLVDKGKPGKPYVLQVVCERVGGSWTTHSDSNGYGWTATRMDDPLDQRNLGVLTFWNEAPADAGAVTVRWKGQEHTVPVAAGHYLFTVWDVPDDDFEETPELLPAGSP
jgi:hypothetical protein